MKNQLFEEAKRSDTLSRRLIDNLLESMQYSSISFINWTIDVLRILRTRIERGDKIHDEVSGVLYTKKSFQEFVKKNFSSYIYSQVFSDPKKAEKVYFTLEACEGGYNLVIAPSSKEKNLSLDLQSQRALFPGRDDRHRHRLYQGHPEQFLYALPLPERKILPLR